MQGAYQVSGYIAFTIVLRRLRSSGFEKKKFIPHYLFQNSLLSSLPFKCKRSKIHLCCGFNDLFFFLFIFFLCQPISVSHFSARVNCSITSKKNGCVAFFVLFMQIPFTTLNIFRVDFKTQFSHLFFLANTLNNKINNIRLLVEYLNSLELKCIENIPLYKLTHVFVLFRFERDTRKLVISSTFAALKVNFALKDQREEKLPTAYKRTFA